MDLGQKNPTKTGVLEREFKVVTCYNCQEKFFQDVAEMKSINFCPSNCGGTSKYISQMVQDCGKSNCIAWNDRQVSKTATRAGFCSYCWYEIEAK